MESLSSAPEFTLYAKQQELLKTFSSLLEKHCIDLCLNEPPSDLFKGQVVSLDVEHDESGGFVGVGLLILGTNRVYYISDISILCSLDLSSIHAVAHNGLTDIDVLQSWGVKIEQSQIVHDTMLIAHIIDSSLKTYGLKDTVERELGVVYPNYSDIVGKKTLKQSKERITLDKQPVELVAMYNACDVFFTAKLYEKQVSQLRSGSDTSVSQYFYDLEKPVSNIFAAMEDRGLCVDIEYLKGLKMDLEVQQVPLIQAIHEELGDINLNSPKQLLEALNAKGIEPVLKNKPSTDKRALSMLANNAVVSSLLAYGEVDTLLSSFVLPYLKRGQTVVHPRFDQCGTRTGRPSCSNPNLLQIPRRTENGKRVRRMFTARPGMLMGDCDYGQIEPRVLAHLSGDSALCQLFNDSVDFHAYTAERLGISRDRAKILNLSVGYRATFKSVVMQLKCGEREAQNEIDKWWNLFPDLRRWQDGLIYESLRSGFCTSLYGRRIKIEGLSHGSKWRREASQRQLINNITQGSAAEIMKRAMIDIVEGYPSAGLLCQVYDELLFEAPKEQIEDVMKYVLTTMENCVILKVPLVADGGIGSNWAEVKK